MSHTPGLWMVYESDLSRKDSPLFFVCGRSDAKRRICETSSADDAVLLAAAPDLLDALHAFCGDYDSLPDRDIALETAYRFAKLAIAKAEGRS